MLSQLLVESWPSRDREEAAHRSGKTHGGHTAMLLVRGRVRAPTTKEGVVAGPQEGTKGTSQSSKAGKKVQLSPWLIGSLAAAVVVFYTTFQRLITIPVVSNYVGGGIFGMATYVRGLAIQYSPWLDKMMNASAGATTAKLLSYGSIGLIAIAAIAIVALVALVLHFAFALASKPRMSRVFGLLGFILALVVPLVMIAVARLVAWQMTNDIVSLDVIALTPAPLIQLGAALLGVVFVVLATKGTEG